MRIGKDTLTGTAANASATSNKLLYGTGQQAVLSANQKLIGAYIGWGGKSANPTGSPVGEIGLYDVTGSNFTTAPKIFSVGYSFSNAALSGAQWIYIPLNVDVSAHAGKTLAVGFAAPNVGHGFDVILETVTGATRKNGSSTANTLASTLASSTVTNNQAWALYFETETISAGASIDTLGTTGTVRVGATENITTTGLGNLTTALVGGIAPSAIAAPSGDGTITIADFIDGIVYPAMGTVTTAVGDGTATASKTDTTLTTKTGWQYVNVSSLSASEFSVGSAFGGGDLPSQLHLINDGTGVLNPDGTLTNWAIGTYTCWARMLAGTYAVGTMKSFTFTVHEPVNTSGSDLNVATSFTSPAVTPHFIIAPDSFSVSTSFSSPVLAQSSLVNAADFVVAVQLINPALSAVGYIQPNDLLVVSTFASPAISSAGSIVVHDMTSAVSLSIPVVGDLPTGPIYGDRIVQIIGTKIIVQILK